MPSDLAPISTTTCVAVNFSTVPLMTRSSLTASSVSVVKVSSAVAKSSAAGTAGASSTAGAAGAGGGVSTGATVCTGASAAVASASFALSTSATAVVVDSELGAVVSSNKVMPL